MYATAECFPWNIGSYLNTCYKLYTELKVVHVSETVPNHAGHPVQYVTISYEGVKDAQVQDSKDV